jgi:hypothetical protein
LLTVNTRDSVAVCWGKEESVTRMVKLKCPVCVVVPESDPADFTAILVGRVPEVSDQL